VQKVYREIANAIETVGPTDATVLVIGESGTGKELEHPDRRRVPAKSSWY
jgi:DNA-binding NtrC family response regulator